MAMSDRIKERRTAIGLSQEELADKLSVSKGAVGNYETGLSKPKIEVLIKMFDVLKTDANYLLQDEIKNIEYKISADERKILDKYRKLDVHGKTMVDFTVNEEYNRCTAPKEQEKQPTITISYSRLPASAGTGDFLQEEYLEEREFPDTPISRQADIVIPVDGRSMEPIFYDGDELYVRLQPAVNPGEIGIFQKGEKGFVKKFAEDRLISLNPNFDDIYPSESEDEEIRCVGKVLGKVE